MKAMRWEKAPYFISTDPNDLDLDRIHAFLSRSYWAQGIPKELVGKSARNSLCFGVYLPASRKSPGGAPAQVGFARVISDYATFGYLADVYVEPEHRGRGLSKWLMECVMSHPELQGLRRFCLGTRDAHGLYQKFGFDNSRQPENWMEIRVPDIYLKAAPPSSSPPTRTS